MIQPSILIIDDEAPIRKLLKITLSANDFHISEADCGKAGLITAAMHPPDIILLDLGLPDEDGQLVLKKLREWYTGAVIILSVRNSEDEIVYALDNGANDYLTKPFRMGELLARIRSALRSNRPDDNASWKDYDNLTIDFVAHTVKKNGEIIKLTATEYALLTLFARNVGKVLSHQFILKVIWGPGFQTQSQYLRVYVGQLRKKIEDDPNQPKFIVTESGVGYRFVCS